MERGGRGDFGAAGWAIIHSSGQIVCSSGVEVQTLTSAVTVRERVLSALETRITKMIGLAKHQIDRLETTGEIEKLALDIYALRFRPPAIKDAPREARIRMVKVLGAVAADPMYDPDTCLADVESAGYFGSCDGQRAAECTLQALGCFATLLVEVHCDVGGAPTTGAGDSFGLKTLWRSLMFARLKRFCLFNLAARRGSSARQATAASCVRDQARAAEVRSSSDHLLNCCRGDRGRLARGPCPPS